MQSLFEVFLAPINIYRMIGKLCAKVSYLHINFRYFLPLQEPSNILTKCEKVHQYRVPWKYVRDGVEDLRLMGFYSVPCYVFTDVTEFCSAMWRRRQYDSPSVGTYLTKNTAFLVGRTDTSAKLLPELRISPFFQLLVWTFYFLQLHYWSVDMKPETKLYLVLHLIFSHFLVTY